MYWVVRLLSYRHFSHVINNRNKEVLKAFGNNLRKLRLAKGLSQQELEFTAGISKNQIGNIERGEVNVTLITATAISKALELPTKSLFDY